jgi:hypothetical protein
MTIFMDILIHTFLSNLKQEQQHFSNICLKRVLYLQFTTLLSTGILFTNILYNMINIHESFSQKTFAEQKLKLSSYILIGKDSVNVEFRTTILNHQNDGHSCGSYSLIYILLKSIKFDVDLSQFNLSSNIHDIHKLILQDIQHYVFQSKQAKNWLSIQYLM